MRARCLGRSQDGAVGSLDERSLESERAPVEVDVGPAKRHELSSAGSGGGSQDEEQMEQRIGLGDAGEQAAKLNGRCWPHLDGLRRRRSGRRGRVVPDPLPTRRLSETPVEHGVRASDRPDRQRSAVDVAVDSEPSGELIDRHRRQVSEEDVAEAGGAVAVDDRAGVAHRRRRPVGDVGREPAFEQVGRCRASADDRGHVGHRSEVDQLPLGLGPAPSGGAGVPAATAR